MPLRPRPHWDCVSLYGYPCGGSGERRGRVGSSELSGRSSGDTRPIAVGTLVCSTAQSLWGVSPSCRRSRSGATSGTWDWLRPTSEGVDRPPYPKARARRISIPTAIKEEFLQGERDASHSAANPKRTDPATCSSTRSQLTNSPYRWTRFWKILRHTRTRLLAIEQENIPQPHFRYIVHSRIYSRPTG